jgi:L-amino acid N-acyltransferase
MIRSAQASDAPAVATIWNHYIRETTVTFALAAKTEAEVATLIATRPAFFVAGSGTTVAGFATYAQFRPGDGYALCMEHTLMLAPVP